MKDNKPPMKNQSVMRGEKNRKRRIGNRRRRWENNHKNMAIGVFGQNDEKKKETGKTPVERT